MNMSNDDKNKELNIKDCEFIGFRISAGGKLIINLIPELVLVDCTVDRCKELAAYHIHVVAPDERNDMIAALCYEHYRALDNFEQLDIPVQLVH